MKVQIPSKFRPLYKPSRYKVFYGGRGGGKSHAIAAALITLAANKPLRILCAREVQNSITDSVMRLLQDKIKFFNLGGFFTSTLTEIRGKNGSLFLFKGVRGTSADGVKSFEGADICWLEEASSISKRSWELLTPTIRKPGSEIWVSFNPDKEDDPVYDAFLGGEPPPSSVVVKVNYWDNPWFPDTLRAEMEWMKIRDYQRYLHVWEGECNTRSEARIFKNWVSEPFDTPEGAIFYFGCDWGYSIDPSVLVRCWIDDKAQRLYVDYEAWQLGCEIDNLHELFETVPRSHDFRICADSSKPDQISYLRRPRKIYDDSDNLIQTIPGYRMIGAKKGPGSIVAGIEFLQGYDIVIHPRCTHTLEEFKSYSYKIDKRTDEILSEIEDKDNHVIDSIRYATERIRRKQVRVPAAPSHYG